MPHSSLIISTTHLHCNAPLAMGRTVFICPIPSVEAFDAAYRAMVHHNTTEEEWVCDRDPEEAAELDPTRAGPTGPFSNEMLQFLLLSKAAAYAQRPEMFEDGLMDMLPDPSNLCLSSALDEKWTRGEDMDIRDMVLVKHKGVLYLETRNHGGGADTTEWLEENYPKQGWMGTRGKPDGFLDSPVVAEGNAAELRRYLSKLLAK